MSNKYTYDSTGLPTAYLLLSLLLPIILYILYTELRSIRTYRCRCITCISLHRTSKWKINYAKIMILLVLLPLCSYLIHLIMTTSEPMSMNFDPYQVLGVDSSSSKKDIKRAFRKIVKTNNPDIPGLKAEEKTKITDYLFEVGRAYTLLLDKGKMDNYMHDKRNFSEIYAIPQFIFNHFNGEADNKISSIVAILWILGFYVGCVVIVLPWYAFKAWKKSMSVNGCGISYNTAGTFYEKMKIIKGGDHGAWFIDLVCLSEEARTCKWNLEKWAVKELNLVKDKNTNQNSINEYENKELKIEKISNEKVAEDSELNESIKIENNSSPNKSKQPFDLSHKGTIISDDTRRTIKKTKQDESFKNKKQRNISKKTIKKEIINVKKSRYEILVCDFIKQHIENHFGYPLKTNQSIGYYILMDHLFRTHIFSNETKQIFIKNVSGMIQTCKKIALVRENSGLFYDLFDAERMLFQSIFDVEWWRLQIPGTKFYDLIENNICKNDNFNVPRIEIQNIDCYIDEEKKNEGEDEDFENIKKSKDIDVNNNETHNIVENISKVDLNNNIVKNESNSNVEKDKIYDPLSRFNSQDNFILQKDSLVTIKITLKRPGDTKQKDTNTYFIKTKGIKDMAVFNTTSGKNILTRIHCPYISILNPKKYEYLRWEIVAEENGSVINKTYFILSDFVGEKDVYMHIDGKQEANDISNIRITVNCGAYFGSDVGKDLTIKYI